MTLKEWILIAVSVTIMAGWMRFTLHPVARMMARGSYVAAFVFLLAPPVLAVAAMLAMAYGLGR